MHRTHKTYFIYPNNALGMGFLLEIVETFPDGDQAIWDIIPCHNRPTADFLGRSICS